MKPFRYRLAALLVWLAVFFNLERLHKPVNIASFVYVLAGALAVAIVVVPPLRRAALGFLAAGALLLLFCLKPLLGYGLAGTSLTLTVTESAALLLTVVLAHQIALHARRFEQSAAYVASVRWHARPASFDEGQADMYRELRRARRFGRPLSIVALEPTSASLKTSADRLIEEVRGEMIQRYVEVRLAEALRGEVHDFDLIASYEGRFLVLLPEADGVRAHEAAQRIAQRVERELGLQLRVGTAAFPGDEVTLTGLVERAESSMLHPSSQPAEEFQPAPPESRRNLHEAAT